MNPKSILLASLVLATPACAVTPADMAEVGHQAQAVRVSLGAKTFESRDTFKTSRGHRDSAGVWVEYEATVRYRITFAPAQAPDGTITYAYDGEGGMEYEAIIETVEVGVPNSEHSLGSTYYAKQTDIDTYQLFDCDSTNNCSDRGDHSTLTREMVAGVEVIRLSGLFDNTSGRGNSGLYFAGISASEMVFDRVN